MGIGNYEKEWLIREFLVFKWVVAEIWVVIIRLSYAHGFYENAFSKTVLDTYTVLFGGSRHLRRLVWWF